MNFKFPVKRINEFTWFLDAQDNLRFGEVTLITIAIAEEACKVYYRLKTGAGEYTVSEEQITGQALVVPQPKYTPFDSVFYEYTDGNTIIEGQGIIDCVCVKVYDQNHYEITYEMVDGQTNVFEEDVSGFTDFKLTNDDMPEDLPGEVIEQEVIA